VCYRSVLPPIHSRAQHALGQPADLTCFGLSPGHRLVVEDVSVDGGAVHPLRAGFELDADQDGCPALENLSRPPGSLVQIVSRDAVFDDDAMLRIDHLLSIYRR
jgi:hypothetical protein